MDVVTNRIDKDTLELLSCGIILYKIESDQARLLYANRAALMLFECENLADMQEFCQGNYFNAFHQDDLKHYYDTIRIQWQSDSMPIHHFQYRVMTRHDHTKLIDDMGRIVEIQGVGQCELCELTRLDLDVTYSLGGSDELTGVLSFGQFIQTCASLLKNLKVDEDQEKYYIAYFNIRKFKDYNIQYGQKQGDRVLKRLARMLRTESATGIVTRITGDQFAAISKSQQANDLIHNVIDQFHEEYFQYGMYLDVGIYLVEGYDTDIHKACDLAKLACDSARGGIEHVSLYNVELSRKMERENYIVSHLDTAIEKGWIQVYYQPVMRVLTGQLCGMEALARWIDPQYGFLSPADFIPPLEDSRLIARLDFHILKLICRDMNDREKHHIPLVPVSFNLSRYDLLTNDCFAETEKIVSEYRVARDMINIEITESVFVENPDIIRNECERFRHGGYQIWMDDFGSGYSSLNVLADFQFDEIKLDMKFLSKFDETTKEIIAAIVVMAKKLGIHTLQEGVETQEHVDFLRSIGCERVQGYLFSKPMPLPELSQKMENDHVPIERRAWRNYYDHITGWNVVTDRALALIEYNGTDFAFLFVNDAFKDVWRRIDATDMETVYNTINSPSSPLFRQFREMVREMRGARHSHTIVYSVRGHYVRLTAILLAEREEYSTYDIELEDLSKGVDEEKRDNMDMAFRNMYALYDALFLLEPDKNRFETLIAPQTDQVEATKQFLERKKLDMNQMMDLFIYTEDQKAYQAFMDMDTLEDRMKHQDRRYVTQYFRTRVSNGAYIWKAHTLMPLKEGRRIIYSSQKAFFHQKELLTRLSPSYMQETVPETGAHYRRQVRKTLMESHMINLFWKDKNRRFLGANRGFLDIYGFNDISSILGKTDEEMGWHVDGEPIDDAEWRVIRQGEVIHNQIGQCIIQGALHNILINKAPIYEGEKIVGLLGFFIDLDNLDQDLNVETTGSLSQIDPITGMMSAVGITWVLTEYTDRWLNKRENFTIIRLYIPEYYRIHQSYGDHASRQMLRELANRMKENLSDTFVWGRLFAANFVVIGRHTDNHEARRMTEELVTKISNIHELCGYATTLHPSAECYFADETDDIQAMVGLGNGGTVTDIAERKKLEEQLTLYNI